MSQLLTSFISPPKLIYRTASTYFMMIVYQAHSSTMVLQYPLRSNQPIKSLIPQHVGVTTDPVIIGKLMNTPNRRQSMVLIINHIASCSLHIIHRQRIHLCHHLSQRHHTSNCSNLLCHLLSSGNIPIKTGQYLRLEGNLGPGKFFVTHTMSKTDKVRHDIPQQIIQLVIGGGGNHTKQSSIRITQIKCRNGRRKLVIGHLLTHGRGNILSKSIRLGEGSQQC
mmetsp:Transcript_18419/g.27522  ORF Transcript_18419/g.27522 Transcript_18419/m.27522 type:complete len:223 (-) Transcript_18419:157-825(-)